MNRPIKANLLNPPLIIAFVALLALPLLSSCSQSQEQEHSDGDGSMQATANTESQESGSNSNADSAKNMAVSFVSPYYTVTLPSDYAQSIEVRTCYQEHSLGPQNDTWGSNSPWFGFETSFVNNGYCDFFVYCSKALDDGSVAGPQGTFITQDVGSIDSWHILVCRAIQPWQDGYNSEAEQAKLSTFASYVNVSFQPYDLSDANFIQYLLTNSGRDWLAAQESQSDQNSLIAKMQHVLCSSNWDCLIGDIDEETVRDQSAQTNIDFIRMALDDSTIKFKSPISAYTLCTYGGFVTSEAKYGIKRVEVQKYQQKVTVTIAFSIDDGQTWKKDEWTVKLPEAETEFNGAPSSNVYNYYARLSFESNLFNLTFWQNESLMNDSEASQSSLQENAQTMINSAIASGLIEGSLDCSPSGLAPLSSDSKIVWVIPGKFENYKFDVVDGYYVKIKTTRQANTSKDSGIEKPPINELYAIYEVYDYGNGKTCIRSVTNPNLFSLNWT